MIVQGYMPSEDLKRQCRISIYCARITSTPTFPSPLTYAAAPMGILDVLNTTTLKRVQLQVQGAPLDTSPSTTLSHRVLTLLARIPAGAVTNAFILDEREHSALVYTNT